MTMPKYRINYTRTYSEYLEVEADSAAEAVEEANTEGIQDLGVCCTGGMEFHDWGREDDGEPQLQSVEVENGNGGFDPIPDEEWA